MEWLRENWFWLVVLILFVGMHMGHGHGGHGHAGHGPRGREGGTKPDDSGPGRSDPRHGHDEDDPGGRHAQH